MLPNHNKTANGQTKGQHSIIKYLHRQHPAEIPSTLLNEQHTILKTLQYFLRNKTQFRNALKGQSPTQKSLKRTKNRASLKNAKGTIPTYEIAKTNRTEYQKIHFRNLTLSCSFWHLIRMLRILKHFTLQRTPNSKNKPQRLKKSWQIHEFISKLRWTNPQISQ